MATHVSFLYTLSAPVDVFITYLTDHWRDYFELRNNIVLRSYYRTTSRKRFLKLTTVKFTVSERPYASGSRKLERFKTDHPQSLNHQISKQQITRGHNYSVFYFVFLHRRTLSAPLFEVYDSSFSLHTTLHCHFTR